MVYFLFMAQWVIFFERVLSPQTTDGGKYSDRSVREIFSMADIPENGYPKKEMFP